MPNFTVISRERHGALRWSYPENLSFIADEVSVPVIGPELAAAVPAMPLSFIRQATGFSLVAMLSLKPGRNLFVGPAGNWLGGYAPAAVRSYPFRLLKPEGASEPVLCIDEEFGIVSEERGERFFEDGGAVSPALQAVLEMQIAMERGRIATDAAVASLAAEGVIAPWPFNLNTEEGGQTVDGIYRIDETALGQLPEAAFCRLRASGALPIAYGQLFSMRQLSVFHDLARMQAKLAPKPVMPLSDSLDHLFDHSVHLELKFD